MIFLNDLTKAKNIEVIYRAFPQSVTYRPTVVGLIIIWDTTFLDFVLMNSLFTPTDFIAYDKMIRCPDFFWI